MDFYLHRNSEDIHNIHERAQLRYAILGHEVEKFNLENTILVKERRVQIDDTLTAKYSGLKKKLDLKQETGVYLSPEKVQKIGKGYLASNIFLQNHNPYDVLNYAYDKFKRGLNSEAEKEEIKQMVEQEVAEEF